MQAELKVEWGREKYINYLNGEERGAIAWLRLGDGWPIIWETRVVYVYVPYATSRIAGNTSLPIDPKRNG